MITDTKTTLNLALKWQLLKTAVMRCFSNSLELWGIKIKRIFRNRKYDVYCPYCTSWTSLFIRKKMV
jgi:hypothetical protein